MSTAEEGVRVVGNKVKAVLVAHVTVAAVMQSTARSLPGSSGSTNILMLRWVPHTEKRRNK
jgi:hypothetical protein